MELSTIAPGYDAASSPSLLLSHRGGSRHALPVPLNDQDGGGECYPTDENEVGP